MGDTGAGTITSTKDFTKTPSGLQKRWMLEISAAKENCKEWHKQAEDANKRYLGGATNEAIKSRLNLFHANINIVLAILYGQVPKVDVSRRFDDANDDVARVSSEALQRHLNMDIEDDADDFTREVRDVLQDWKITGLGVARLRYEVEMEMGEETPAIQDEQTGEELAPAIPAQEQKTSEDICTDYVYWRDFLWSPARRWKEVRWVAFRVEMTRDDAAKRFGQKIAARLPLQNRNPSKRNTNDDQVKDAWSRVELWEIWSKEDETVYWFCEGFDRILDQKEDPMELEGFFPCPRPLISNTTTSKLIPKPDLELDKHLYDEIDDLADRLRKLVKMARLTGAYNKSTPELGRILEEAYEGQLVPVSGWAALMENGGIAGAIQFTPLDMIVKAIEVLTTKLAEKINLLYQATGLSDIVRGEASQKATATEQRLKAGFASTRLQTDQDEVSRFASDLQRLRAEIISKHYDAKTIVDRSNMERVEVVPDPTDPTKKVPNLPLIQKAVELIKSDFWQYRIEVKSDAIALRDYAALKQERVEAIGSLASLFAQAVPMIQIYPQAAPFMLEIGKWLIAATKGSQQLEASFDRFADQVEAAANQPKPPPPPDPKLQAAQVKAQAEMGKAQASVQQTQVDGAVHVQKARMDLTVAQQKHQMDMAKMAAQTEAEAARAAAAFANPPPGKA